ncbi:MAG: N-methyl-L-tryptophan oxidase [Euzebyales bacterium]|nr:N-methyl-L-tryptophan oxidase [Euzebyales bacterium]
MIVVGLGGMGSAVAAHLATRGRRVLGLDRFTPPHDRGSSHGRSRIIRQLYFEGAGYVPLVQRAYELWEILQRDTRRDLLTVTGGLVIGPPDGEVVVGALASARQHGLAHQVLDSEDVASRFAALRVQAGHLAVYEEAAGILVPEACVAGHLEMAARRGAELRTGEKVNDWRVARGGGVVVSTTSGVEAAEQLVVAAGAWSGDVIASPVPLQVERQFVGWLRPTARPELFRPDRLPWFYADRGEDPPLYGIPDLAGDGVKVAFDHAGVTVSPDDVPAVRSDEMDELVAASTAYLPRLNGASGVATTCLYTNTPDGHFVVGRPPESPEVMLVTGFSGHGFKFCPVIGEVVTDLVVEGGTAFDVSAFAPSRTLPTSPGTT